MDGSAYDPYTADELASNGPLHPLLRAAFAQIQQELRMQYLLVYKPKNVVPEELVAALGWEEWQTPANGPFPAFSADAMQAMVDWLVAHGYTAQVVLPRAGTRRVDEVPS